MRSLVMIAAVVLLMSGCGVKDSLHLADEQKAVPRDPVPTLAPAVTPGADKGAISPEQQLEEMRQYRP